MLVEDHLTAWEGNDCLRSPCTECANDERLSRALSAQAAKAAREPAPNEVISRVWPVLSPSMQCC